MTKNLNLEEKGGNVWVAISIIIAGLLVAGAVVMTQDTQPKNRIPTSGNNIPEEINGKIPEVTAEDHIRGNINAPIKIVEYSDIECPFCKRLHETMKKVVSEYPDDVAWVYRHLPIVSSHPKAVQEAIATECVAEMAGNDMFWNYLDKLYEATPGNNRMDLSLLPKIAGELGLDVDAFNQCIKSGKYDAKIAQQTKDGFASGAQGTPFSVVITPDGSHIAVPGAQPIETWRQVIDSIIANELKIENAGATTTN